MSETFLVVGLGNPGPDYDRTRHNIGFEVVDALAKRWGVSFSSKFRGHFGQAEVDGHRVYLLKPQTYMNLSGGSVADAATFFKISLQTHLIVLSDDIDLIPGLLRLRKSGSCGGHNGLRSLEECLGTSEFPRLRIGVGRGPGPADKWVLRKMNATEVAEFVPVVTRAADGIALIFKEGVERAMNTVNQKLPPPTAEGVKS